MRAETGSGLRKIVRGGAVALAASAAALSIPGDKAPGGGLRAGGRAESARDDALEGA